MFPALVGMNRTDFADALPYLYVPRTRGDEPELQRINDLNALCSPHSWG